MSQLFVPSPYEGGPCAIIDTCEDGSMADFVSIIENNPHGRPEIYVVRLDTLNSLVDRINAVYKQK